MNCLDRIVGITPADMCSAGCSFIGISQTESLSGMYLTDIDEGYIPLNQAIFEDPNAGLNNLITSATHEVIRELRLSMEKMMTPMYREISEYIGNADNYTAFMNDGPIKYVVLKPKNINGFVLRIKSISILGDASYTGNVLITKKGVEIYNNTIANFVPINIPMDGEVIISHTAQNVRNFKHTLCCGYTPSYGSYMQVGSGATSSLVGTQFTSSDYSQGIVLDVTYQCDPFLGLCNVDFVNSKFGLSFAQAVKQTARKNLAYWLMITDMVTPYTSIKAEELANISKYLQEDLNILITYMPTVYGLTDCFRCKTLYSKGEILI